MATYVLVPGADGTAWYWHLVAPLLRERGHAVVTLDLPSHDTASLDDFAEAITAAVHAAVPDGSAGPEAPLVVVGQSLGGFSAPLVCGPLPVDRLVLVNAMVPAPGESAGEWWGNVGQAEAREQYAEVLGRTGTDAEFDPRTDFFHDVPDALTEEAFAGSRPGRRPGCSRSPGRWPRGRTCRPVSCKGAETASFPWSSSAGWPANVSASTSRNCPAAIWSRSAARVNWRPRCCVRPDRPAGWGGRGGCRVCAYVRPAPSPPASPSARAGRANREPERVGRADREPDRWRGPPTRLGNVDRPVSRTRGGSGELTR